MSISTGTTVLVTGATGAVGPCVLQALCKAGHAISARFRWIGRLADNRPRFARRATRGRRQTINNGPVMLKKELILTDDGEEEIVVGGKMIAVRSVYKWLLEEVRGIS